MNFFTKIFGTKEHPTSLDFKEANTSEIAVRETVPTGVDAWRYGQILSMLDGLVHPSVVGNNFIEMFRTIPEVFWPINYIAKRISEAHYDLRRTKDKSIVVCNRLNIDSILNQPNPVMTWREIVYQHFIYKLATGNAFFRAAMSDAFTEDAIKCQYCSNYWELPAHKVTVEPMGYSYGVPIFGIATKEEIIKGYKLGIEPYSNYLIPHYQIWHDRDGLPEFTNRRTFLKANSRLMSVKKPIANLIAVYEARNVIYVKRGGLGFIVAEKKDETGTLALDPAEKEELRQEIDKKYGVGEGQSPYGVTDIPINFVRTNLSISELQPFDETLEDAIKIAGAYDIPAVLVPRKDQSTFSNQDSAEKSVYTSTIIPSAKRFCEELTVFLGLDKKGYYLDCDFSDVACLQTGRKDKETVKDMEFNRGLKVFNAGLCTLDDILGAMHKEPRAEEIPLFGKLKFQMTPEELETVNNIIKNQTTSKGESNERDDEKPSV